MSVDIVEVGADMASFLEALHKECFDPPECWDAFSFAQLFSSPGVRGWVAQMRDGALIGMLLVRCIMGEYEILTLGVGVRARRCGVGRELLEFLIQCICNEGDIIFLEVSVHNTVARHLYDTMGFIPVGHRKRYYDDGSDALVLRFSVQ